MMRPLPDMPGGTASCAPAPPPRRSIPRSAARIALANREIEDPRRQRAARAASRDGVDEAVLACGQRCARHDLEHARTNHLVIEGEAVLVHHSGLRAADVHAAHPRFTTVL